jgi:hypothetical protein
MFLNDSTFNGLHQIAADVEASPVVASMRRRR